MGDNKNNESMQAWEKAITPNPPKQVGDFGQIGRAQDLGFVLADLNTDSLINLLNEIVVNNSWIAKVKAKKLIKDYTKFRI